MERDLADVTEKTNYAAFVDQTLQHLGNGLALDGTERKTAIGAALNEMAKSSTKSNCNSHSHSNSNNNSRLGVIQSE